MEKKNIVPKWYSNERRTFLVRTEAGFDVQVRLFGTGGHSANTRNMAFGTLSFYPQIPGGTDCRESIHCKTSVRADMLAELDRVMRVSGNPNYSIIQEEYSIYLGFDTYKMVSFDVVGIPGQGQVQCRVCYSEKYSHKEPSETTIPVDIKKRDQLLSEFRDIYAKLYIHYDFPEAARKKALKEALKGRPYKIEFPIIKHAFCFSSPAIPQEVWVLIVWSKQYVADFELKPKETYIHICTRENTEFWYCDKFLWDALETKPYTEEITCSPTNKREIVGAVKRCLKEAGIPVTRLLKEFIHMEMTDFRHSLDIDFMGVPGRRQLKCKTINFIDDGRPYLDIKDIDKVFAFAKRMFTLSKKFCNNKLSDDESMEFLELYNAVDDYEDENCDA